MQIMGARNKEATGSGVYQNSPSYKASAQVMELFSQLAMQERAQTSKPTKSTVSEARVNNFGPVSKPTKSTKCGSPYGPLLRQK